MSRNRQRENDIASLKGYAVGLGDALYRDCVEPYQQNGYDSDPAIDKLDWMLQLLHLGLCGELDVSSPSIKIAEGRRVYHPRDWEEAALVRAESKTPYSIGSWRVIISNFDRQGHIFTTHDERVSDALRTKYLALRVRSVWLCDEHGLADQRVEALQAIIDSLALMESQVRESFLAIEKRQLAIHRLNSTAGYVSSLPVEGLSFQLQEAADPVGAMRGVPGSYLADELDLDLSWNLGGDREFAVVHEPHCNEYRPIMTMDMGQMTSYPLLAMLDRQVDLMQHLYGPDTSR